MSPSDAKQPPNAPVTSKRPLWKPIVVAIAFASILAGAGAGLTSLDDWYYSLKFPSWKPPDAAFGPIWTTIFALCVVVAVLGWQRLPTLGRRRSMVAAFVVNGLLNILWSLLYFKLHRPDWSLVEVPFLWLSVLAVMLVLRPVRIAALLLLPYLVWVAIAAVLNWEIVKMNGPFG